MSGWVWSKKMLHCLLAFVARQATHKSGTRTHKKTVSRKLINFSGTLGWAKTAASERPNYPCRTSEHEDAFCNYCRRRVFERRGRRGDDTPSAHDRNPASSLCRVCLKTAAHIRHKTCEKQIGASKKAMKRISGVLVWLFVCILTVVPFFSLFNLLRKGEVTESSASAGG